MPEAADYAGLSPDAGAQRALPFFAALPLLPFFFRLFRSDFSEQGPDLFGWLLDWVLKQKKQEQLTYRGRVVVVVVVVVVVAAVVVVVVVVVVLLVVVVVVVVVVVAVVVVAAAGAAAAPRIARLHTTRI